MTVVGFFFGGGRHAQKLKFGDSRSISVFKQCQSNALDDCFFLGWSMRRSQNLEIVVLFLCSSNVKAMLKMTVFFGWEHAQKPNSTEKKNFTRHFAWLSFARLSLAFILKYYPIFHGVER